MSLLALPGVGCLTGKNIFQILHRVPAIRGFKAAGGNSHGEPSNPFAFSGPGSRMAVNLLFAEPGGKGFLRDAASLAALRRYHLLVMFLKKAFLKEMRSLVGNSSVLTSVAET